MQSLSKALAGIILLSAEGGTAPKSQVSQWGKLEQEEGSFPPPPAAGSCPDEAMELFSSKHSSRPCLGAPPRAPIPPPAWGWFQQWCKPRPAAAKHQPSRVGAG